MYCVFPLVYRRADGRVAVRYVRGEAENEPVTSSLAVVSPTLDPASDITIVIEFDNLGNIQFVQSDSQFRRFFKRYFKRN
jgi:hypothetical protein